MNNLVKIGATVVSLFLLVPTASAQNPAPGNPNSGGGNVTNSNRNSNAGTPLASPRTDNTRSLNSTSTSALGEAMEMNVAEVNVGRIAESKAENSRVKSFAAMMVKDHSDAVQKLQSIPGGTSAEMKNMKANSHHQATADRLSKLSGKEFDREFINAMVSDHEEALTTLKSSKFEGSSNSDLAKASKDMIPTVQKHLDEARQIQKDMGWTSTTTRTGTTNTSANSGTRK